VFDLAVHEQPLVVFLRQIAYFMQYASLVAVAKLNAGFYDTACFRRVVFNMQDFKVKAFEMR